MRFLRIATLTLLLFAAYAAKCQLATGVNYNATTPAAPNGARNVTWQNDGGRPTVNASAFVTYPTLQVMCPASGDLASPVNTTLGALSSSQGGIADARACVNATTWSTAITISVPNTVILLPCASLTQSQPITVAAQTRNVTLHGCSYMGGSASSGTVGGTVLNFTGSTAAFIVGDSGYVYDTPGFTLTDLAVVTASAGSGAHAINLYRAQEVHMENLYLIGNTLTGQTAIVLDGTGNYTGGYFANLKIDSFGTAALLTGHLSGSVVDDYANASTFIKVHVDCPTSGGSPVAGTYGFNVAGGDGNTWVGGDVEGCSKVMYLGAHANGNTVVGQRSENSTYQYYADTGSTYNYIATGGTFFTGDLFDAGSRNSFWDAFHRTANGINGDWYASQLDATLTNHQRLGIGLGNERGLLNEVQTDYGYRWIYGLTDATAGEQFYEVQDVLSNVNRLSIGQANSGGSSANNQTALNSAGSAAIVLNGSNNSGTGGVVIGSGGSSASEVANFDSAGDLSTLGNHLFYSGATLAYELEGDSGTSFTIQNNNATTPGRVFKSNVNGSTDLDSEGTSPLTVNNTSTGGTGGMSVYKGGASSSVLLFQVNPNGSGTPFMQFPGLAPGSGNSCLYADSSGYFHGTGSACGSGGGGGGTVTSVTITAPSDFVLSGCTITSSGTCAFSWNSSTSGTAPNWNQSTTGNAATATAAASSPSQCSSGQFATGVTTGWAANCAAVQYSQLGGSVPTWNQSTTGNATTATTATNFSGSLSGDVTGTQGSTSVVKINGASVPASTPVLASNSSGQLVAASGYSVVTWGSAGSTLSTSASEYIGLSVGNSTANSNAFVAPRTGTFSYCVGRVDSNETGTAYYTATLYKNGSSCPATAPVLLFNSSTQTQADNTDTCTAAQGDSFVWHIVPTNTPTATAVSFACQF